MHPAPYADTATPAPEPFLPNDLIPGVRLIRRNRQIVPWSASKIEKAVRAAFAELHLDPTPAARIADAVTDRVKLEGNACVGIEDVQDMVQEELMRQGHYAVATHYILYRAERARHRTEMVDGETAPLPSEITIVGPTPDEFDAVLYNPVELHRRIAFARTGLDLCLGPKEIERELLRSVGAEITRKNLSATIILNAKTLIERDADFAKFAGRILLTFIYEEVLDWSILRDGFGKLKKAHRAGFAAYLARGVEIGRIDPALVERYDIEVMAKALDPSADLDFDYLGIQTLYDRYLLVDKTDGEHVRLETPQFFWMRVAMGLFKEEGRDERYAQPNTIGAHYAVSLYNLYKSRRFCSSTPTLFNSGTPHSQLSSCYISVVDDNIESIFQRGIADSAYMAKFAGGLGGSWTNVRGTGSHIKGTNGESQGVIPFFKVYNDMLNAVNQGGKRRGSGCNYLETWHNDLEDFMELRKNVGDDRRRCHEMNTAHWIPDLFMKRMEARQDWSYFRSNEVPDLHDLYGKAFEQRYAEYEALAAEGRIWTKVVPAVEVWKLMLKSVFETGHPWLTFKDPCNVRSPQDHVGVVHSSNLCTEITLNTSADEIAVCNLGSVVIEEHLTDTGEIDHAKLRETVTLAVRALDNVIDINFYPVPATATSNSRHRPIGLGMMGLQNALHKKGLAFASPEAVEFSDEIAEAIAYYAYLASSQLAKEKGAYSTYAGSKWDRGILPQDTIDLLQDERGIPIDTPRGGLMDWDMVRQHILVHGMRNSNVMAIAPTACVTPETLVSGPKGLFAMEEIGDMEGAQWQPVAHDVHQSGSPAKATKFYLNGHRKVRLVRTALGHQTRGTDTHRLKVLMPSGELDWKYLPDLEPGDLVAHKLGGFNPLALVGLQASATGEHHSAAPVTLPEILDGPLACFLGAYMANGYIKYKTSGVPEGIKISLANSKTVTLQELRDTGTAWGVYTGDEEGQGQTTLCFYSRELAEWFVANGWAKPRGNRGEGSAGAFIPVEVRRSPVAIVGAFLHGLFTDGTLGFQPSGAPCLEYSTVSDKLAYQLHALLWAMGFMAKRSTAAPGTLGERTVHRIRLSNVYSTRAFLKVCGWHNGAARNRAMEHGIKHDGYRGMGVTGFPLIAEIAAIIEAPNPELGRELRGAMATAKAQGSIGWHLLQRLVTAEPKVKTTAAWRYLQDGVVLLPVVENEEELELQPTCDLEVPGNHEYVAGGMVNHNTISNIMATTPCIEPNYKNLFVKSNMSGDFTVLSVTLVRELKALGLWGKEMLDQLKYYDGELQDIPNIPYDVKRRHATVFGIGYEFVVDAAARRQKWIDQAQSLNLFLPEADLGLLSRMYRRAWASGLKTTYYLRSLGASNIEKTTIDAGKALRGMVAEAAPVMQCRIDDPTCESCQ